MKKNVLVVGGGGREHAIVDALSGSEHVGKIYAAPGNAGIAAQAECLPIGVGDLEQLVVFVRQNDIDLTVVGPEVPLSNGIADRFEAEGLRIFGPCAAAAEVEASKDFAKRIMTKYDIPTAAYKTFDNYEEALGYVKKGKFPVVLKYDGLAAGKGVVISESPEEAAVVLKDMLLDDKFGRGKVVIEEFLEGSEFSFMCLVCGERVYPLAVSQDHKRAFEGGKGPNTGGMGAYSPVPAITGEDECYALEKIMKPMAAALKKEGHEFNGLLYGGLIKTAGGIKVIEFNCRFGDPETEVVLPRLKSDIYEIFSAVADGTAMPEIRWSEEVSLGFVMASKGYPGSYKKGFEIGGIEEAEKIDGVKVYHMGTSSGSSGRSFVTDGGRVLMVVAVAADLKKARNKALEAIGRIDCKNLFFRRDIGKIVM